MNILLINPNRFDTPPVVPIGLEYIASSLESTNTHTVDILDLCFVSDPEKALKSKVSEKRYDLAAFSIRNIDDVIFPENKFYLSEFKSLIELVKNEKIATVVGGAGCDADPHGLFDYLKPDYLIYGPGEVAILDLVSKIQASQPVDPVINGWKYGINPHLKRNPLKYFDYKKYIMRGAIAAFQIQVGCMGKCHFCFEQSKPVSYRTPDAVIDDIIALSRQGFREFHLADSEFNQDLTVCKNFLKVLQNRLKWAAQTIRWALYMKPKPVDLALFELLKQSGANLITLSVESSSAEQKRNGYSLQDIQLFMDYAQDLGLSVAIDMLAGAPGEPISDLEKIIRLFKASRPKRVNINPVFRIYPNTALYHQLLQRLETEKPKIINYENFENGSLFPAFYRNFSDSEILELIGSDSLFKIEGSEKGVNYQKVK